jgi:hypothetical protein
MTVHPPPGNEPNPYTVPYEDTPQSNTIDVSTTEYHKHRDLLARFGTAIAIAITVIILLVFMCCCGALVVNYTLGH